MGIIKQLIELVYYYRQDTAHGKPYWQDPAFIGLVVSLITTELAKYMGVLVDTDLQLKIVGVITGIGMALSPHTGLVAKPQDEAKEVAQRVQEHNLTNLS